MCSNIFVDSLFVILVGKWIYYIALKVPIFWGKGITSSNKLELLVFEGNILLSSSELARFFCHHFTTASLNYQYYINYHYEPK